MRISMVISSLACGGAESFLIQLINAMAAVPGVETCLINLETDSSLAVFEDQIGDRVQYHKVARHLLIPRSRILLARYLGKHIRQFKPDIINSHLQYTDLVAARCQTARPLVISDHGCFKQNPRPEHHEAITQADLIVCTAKSNQQKFHDHGLTKTQLIRYGLADVPSNITPVERKSLGLADEQFVYCMVARGIIEKGWVEAIEAFSRLQGRKRAAMIMVGEGQGVDQARARCKSLKLENVHFMGFDHCPRRYMRISNVVMLPSRFAAETYPMALLEALYEGRPVLGTQVGDIPDLIKQNGDVLGMVLPLTADQQVPTDALASAMDQMADDYDQYRDAADAVRSKYEIETCAQQYLKAFEGLIEKAKTTKP